MKTLSQVNDEITNLRTTMLTFPKKEHSTRIYRNFKKDYELRLNAKSYLEYEPSDESIRKQYADVKRIVDMVNNELKEMKEDGSFTQFRINKRKAELYKIHNYEVKKSQKIILEYILES